MFYVGLEKTATGLSSFSGNIRDVIIDEIASFENTEQLDDWIERLSKKSTYQDFTILSTIASCMLFDKPSPSEDWKSHHKFHVRLGNFSIGAGKTEKEAREQLNLNPAFFQKK